ncbi:hypothetical protein RclHR1_08690001 [Rhizophagus clarus]|uniref:Uncharacterized protein n=1 Tax=Rhizophagus clarus TaxID=94130 RepID=A0A2Z6S1G2_9GLOM|nr:hypothetical protein RclHR1_08690001 [Rhizophagus clarus]GES78663.1 hypothetical protein RCL_jg21560.t1 [Rhizophagus clarus]
MVDLGDENVEFGNVEMDSVHSSGASDDGDNATGRLGFWLKSNGRYLSERLDADLALDFQHYLEIFAFVENREATNMSSRIIVKLIFNISVIL